MHIDDPRQLIESSPMSRLQILAVTLCIVLVALDGFDVLAISFAAPGITTEWGIDRAALGFVLSMELIGMGVGSIFMGNVADRIGRRPTIIYCLLIMSAGMGLAATAGNLVILSAYRFITGIGIGGILAAANAMVAEYSNRKQKNLCVVLMAGGYPLGAVLGGFVATFLLQHYSWRSVFIFGAATTVLMLPIVLLLLPESVAFLCQKRPKHAVEKINKSLKRMALPLIEALPTVDTRINKQSMISLFSGEFLRVTSVLTFAYFFHIMTFYFLLKWIPKIIVDMGFSASSAGGVLVWANVGGLMGAVVLGLLSLKYRVRALVVISMFAGAVLVAIFGRGQSELSGLSAVAAVAVFFINAGIVGLYALFAQSFPTEIRATGTGFVIGVGRAGAAIGPVAAGLLFQAGFSLQLVAVLMGAGCLAAALILLLLPAAEDTKGKSVVGN